MRSALLRTGTILLLLAAAGCGQKGSLYLPDRTRTPVPAGGEATPAAAAPAAPSGSSGS
jgi:predicted small lipoprotein YifL